MQQHTQVHTHTHAHRGNEQVNRCNSREMRNENRGLRACLQSWLHFLKLSQPHLLANPLQTRVWCCSFPTTRWGLYWSILNIRRCFVLAFTIQKTFMLSRRYDRGQPRVAYYAVPYRAAGLQKRPEWHQRIASDLRQEHLFIRGKIRSLIFSELFFPCRGVFVQVGRALLCYRIPSQSP